MEGFGILNFRGNEKYSGMFMKNKLHGIGELIKYNLN